MELITLKHKITKHRPMFRFNILRIHGIALTQASGLYVVFISAVLESDFILSSCCLFLSPICLDFSPLPFPSSTPFSLPLS